MTTTTKATATVTLSCTGFLPAMLATWAREGHDVIRERDTDVGYTRQQYEGTRAQYDTTIALFEAARDEFTRHDKASVTHALARLRAARPALGVGDLVVDHEHDDVGVVTSVERARRVADSEVRVRWFAASEGYTDSDRHLVALDRARADFFLGWREWCNEGFVEVDATSGQAWRALDGGDGGRVTVSTHFAAGYFAAAYDNDHGGGSRPTTADGPEAALRYDTKSAPTVEGDDDDAFDAVPGVECAVCGAPGAMESELPVIGDGEGGLVRDESQAEIDVCPECAAVARSYPARHEADIVRVSATPTTEVERWNDALDVTITRHADRYTAEVRDAGSVLGNGLVGVGATRAEAEAALRGELRRAALVTLTAAREALDIVAALTGAEGSADPFHVGVAVLNARLALSNVGVQIAKSADADRATDAA